MTSLCSLLLCWCVCGFVQSSRTISPSWAITILDYTSNSLSFTWDVAPPGRRMTYQIWYWPVMSAAEHRKIVTDKTWTMISELDPGRLYNLWLLGISGNNTQDYITFQHRTSLSIAFVTCVKMLKWQVAPWKLT